MGGHLPAGQAQLCPFFPGLILAKESVQHWAPLRGTRRMISLPRRENQSRPRACAFIVSSLPLLRPPPPSHAQLRRIQPLRGGGGRSSPRGCHRCCCCFCFARPGLHLVRLRLLGRPGPLRPPPSCHRRLASASSAPGRSPPRVPSSLHPDHLSRRLPRQPRQLRGCHVDILRSHLVRLCLRLCGRPYASPRLPRGSRDWGAPCHGGLLLPAGRRPPRGGRGVPAPAALPGGEAATPEDRGAGAPLGGPIRGGCGRRWRRRRGRARGRRRGAGPVEGLLLPVLGVQAPDRAAHPRVGWGGRPSGHRRGGCRPRV